MRFRKQLYGDAFVNQFIAEMEGIKTHLRPFAFLDDAGNEYTHIAGAIAMPTFSQPGYLLSIGIRRSDDVIECLDEYESDNEYKIIERARKIQSEYGVDDMIWYGNPVALMPLVGDIQDDKNRVQIAHPVDYEHDDAFQLYVSRLRVALAAGHKTLIIGDCQHLRNALTAFTTDKARMDHHPVITAAGGLVHTMQMLRPWEQATEKTELIPTTTEDIAAYASEHETKMIYKELFAL